MVELVESLDASFTSAANQEEVSRVLHCVVSLVTLCPQQQQDHMIGLLCDKLSTPDAVHSAAKLKALNVLFHLLEAGDPHHHAIYLAMVQLAAASKLMATLRPRLEQIRKWRGEWSLTSRQYQTLLRALHEGLAREPLEGCSAATVMRELLSSFTEDTAGEARQDAHRCVVAAVREPSTFVLDDLLHLKPVKALEGSSVHALLLVFVEGTLQHYLQWYSKHSAFLVENELDHEALIAKMRVLTLMSLAEAQQELSLVQLQQEMQLEEDEVESFIIDVVRTKMVQARLDHVGGKVHLSSTTLRTFGRAQWAELRSRLISWQQNLGAVLNSFESLAHLAANPQLAAQVSDN